MWVAVALVSALSGEARGVEPANADSIRKYRFLAKTAREKKEFDQALQYYGEYLKYETDPERARQAHYRVGQIHFGRKELGRARLAYRRALAVDSLHVNTNLRLYQIYLQEGHPDSAALSLERVVVARPDDAGYRRTLADLYNRQRRARDAIRHYTRLAGEEEANSEIVELLAVLHEDLGEPARALEWRRRLLGAPGSAGDGAATGRDGQVDMLESVLRLQRQTDDVQGAVGTLQQLAAIDSLNRHSYFSRMEALAGETDNKPLRIKALEGMVRASPGDLESVATLAELHLNEGHIEAARKWLDRGLRVDESHAHLQFLKGDLLERDGAEDEAVAAFEKARVDPAWERTAQQRIWNLRPPETKEEQLKREFFGEKAEAE